MDLFEALINATIEGGGVFLGVILGYLVERRRKTREFQRRVIQIVPHIYFEILENKRLLEMYKDNFRRFYSVSNRFKNNYFDLFKNELGSWNRINVVPIPRLYDKINQMNRILENIYEDKQKDRETIQDTYKRAQKIGKANMSTSDAEHLIIKVAKQFEEWFEKNPDAKEEKEKVYAELKINQENDAEIRDFLNWYKEKYLKSE